MSVILGVDIGTSGTKTIAVRFPTGEVIAEASASYPCHHPKPLWSEQDPADWWRATLKTIRQAVKKAGCKPADVKAIGLSGQMHGSVFLDKKDEVVRPALLWNDQRTAAECEEIEQRAGGRKRLIKMVANPALTGFQAPKILWLRNNEPKNFDKTASVLLPKDYIRLKLTGERASEVSDASGTLLLDVAKRRWSKPLLSKLELDPGLLPPVVESHEVTGHLTAEVAKKVGLTTDCVVVGGAGDCAAGAVGNGVVKRGVVATSLGTSGVVFCHSDAPEVDPEGRLHTFCHAVDGKWHMMGVTLSAAGSFQWFADTLCETEKKAAKKSGKSVFETLVAEAATTAAGAQGLFFLPYLTGERTPHADPLARGAFVGLTLSHGRGEMVRSVLEGVTYSLRDCLDIMQELGVGVREVRATGGGAKSPFWRQLQADVFGKKVCNMAADEGPAYGVALLGAVGAGEFKNVTEACDATVSTVAETKPTAKTKKFYDRAMPVYQGLYRSLKEDYRAIAALAE
ncbi:Xylulose kinase [Pseudobythopirellula maris]|uniref:Xylulose kinase n=1 Tax=Pseudobythopirellula maris TaxID=2527991 RepID=A0A5C5ZUN2_9BACT|nr:xylulokinase [Pseudobythopirellula maris]TWT90621.1 Xylulose kinase [Pseudobythopirellula maris]